MGTSDDDSQTSATCHQQLRRSYNACSVTKAKNGKFLNLGSTATTEVPLLCYILAQFDEPALGYLQLLLLLKM